MERDAPFADLRVLAYEKSEAHALLDRGEVDVLIGVFPDLPERFVKTMLFEERFIGLAGTGHPILAEDPPKLEAFAAAKHALVTLKRDAAGQVDKALAAWGLSRRIALTIPHMMALSEILARTKTISVLPERIVAALASTNLKTFALPLNVPPFTVEMAWNPVTRGDQASAWLRRAIAGCVTDARHAGFG